MTATTTVTATLRRGRGLTEEAATAAIDQACRRLRLPTIRAVVDEATATAMKEQLSYHGFLAELLLAECDDRDRRSSVRRVKAAGFPRDKWLGDFDFDANPNINAATINTLATGDWVRKGKPLCLIGDSGTGKSHLLIGLGTAAARSAGLRRERADPPRGRATGRTNRRHAGASARSRGDRRTDHACRGEGGTRAGSRTRRDGVRARGIRGICGCGSGVGARGLRRR